MGYRETARQRGAVKRLTFHKRCPEADTVDHKSGFFTKAAELPEDVRCSGYRNVEPDELRFEPVGDSDVARCSLEFGLQFLLKVGDLRGVERLDLAIEPVDKFVAAEVPLAFDFDAGELASCSEALHETVGPAEISGDFAK
jgi:hypothetical protein